MEGVTQLIPAGYRIGKDYWYKKTKMFICSLKQSGIILKLKGKIIAVFNTRGLVASFIN
jgi:hypothetical protein